MNFKNIIFYVKVFFVFIFVFIYSLFLYLLGNVTSVTSIISVIVISVYYCCQLVNCIVLFVELLIKVQFKKKGHFIRILTPYDLIFTSFV